MVETYGLTKGQPTPSVEDVNAMLDANTSKLMDVSSALVNGTNKIIEANGAKLDGVVKRLVNSVNGHLRKNTGILKPIGNALVEHVDNYLAGNHAIITATASHPAVADFVRSVPAAAGYLPALPVAPPDELKHGGIGAIAAEVMYQILYNPTTKQAVAVPVSAIMAAPPSPWPPAGWKAYGNRQLTPADMLAYLQTQFGDYVIKG